MPRSKGRVAGVCRHAGTSSSAKWGEQDLSRLLVGDLF